MVFVEGMDYRADTLVTLASCYLSHLTDEAEHTEHVLLHLAFLREAQILVTIEAVLLEGVPVCFDWDGSLKLTLVQQIAASSVCPAQAESLGLTSEEVSESL